MGRIILTGGIACGKSTIVEEFKKHDIIVIDSDKIAKNIFTRNIPTIQEMFDTDLKGDELRAYVGKTIFLNPRLKLQLEAFMHPKIRKVIKTKERELKGKKHIIDMPLYFETKHFLDDDFVILVTVTYETQLQRLMDRNHFIKEDADRRIMAQLPSAIKEKKSDCVIDNNGTIEELQENIQKLIKVIFK